MDIIIMLLLGYILILDIAVLLYAKSRYTKCNREDRVIIENKEILLFANYRCRKCSNMFTVVVPKNAVSKLKINGLQINNKMHHCKYHIEDNELVIADLISFSNHRLKGIKELTNLDKHRWRI